MHAGGRHTKDNWEEVIAHRDDVFLEGIGIFKDYLVVEERKNGLTRSASRRGTGQGRIPRVQRPGLRRGRSPTPISTRRSCGLDTAR